MTRPDAEKSLAEVVAEVIEWLDDLEDIQGEEELRDIVDIGIVRLTAALDRERQLLNRTKDEA